MIWLEDYVPYIKLVSHLNAIRVGKNPGNINITRPNREIMGNMDKYGFYWAIMGNIGRLPIFSISYISVCFIYIKNINLISVMMSFYFYFIYIIDIKNYVFYDFKWDLWVGI